MKPGFALDLDEDHIRLLFRRADGWVKVGEVGFADPKLGDKLAALRQKAGRLAPEGVLTKLVIPSSQILYTEVDAPGPDRRARRAQIMKAIDGRTPYALDELTVDWARSGKHTFVAVVAKLTLDEAEDFAEGFGFNPVSFVAIPESGRFDGEPFFGQTRNAEAHARDLAPVLEELRAQGVHSLRGLAAALNERGMLTRRGGRWHVSNVRNLLGRVAGEGRL